MSDHPAPPSQIPQHAELHWDDEGLPLSGEFNDYYFSKLDGLQETRYVYLEHNFLHQRWSALGTNDQFVVAETGFGTGLNFLASWQLWRQTAPTSACLHFISVEKFPLLKRDLCRALALWPELNNEVQALLSQYPAIVNKGFHRLSFDRGRVQLTLIVNEAVDGLEQLLQSTHPAHCRPQRGIDAWFLDGFSPAKNPDMWRPELFELVQKLSAAEATVATFAAATLVKRGLREHGFAVRQDTGFGRKREMVYAKLIQPAPLASQQDFPTNGFNSKYAVPWNIEARSPDIEAHKSSAEATKHAIIVGAGIAGCHTARSLADRGWRVTLLDRHAQLAQEGSGNPQGVLYAKLSHREETLSDFNLLALQFAQRVYQSFWQPACPTESDKAQAGSDATDPGHSENFTGTLGEQCGVLQLACSDKTAQLHEKLQRCYGKQALFEKVDAHQASRLSGIDSACGGLFFPHSGWINPGTLCQTLTDHPNIEIRLNTSVDRLHYEQHSALWRLETSPFQPRPQQQALPPAASSLGTLESSVVVLATASQVRQFPLTEALPLKPIRGQVTYVAASQQSQQLKTVLCGDGYLPPAINRQHCLGATFDPKRLELSINDEDHLRNLNTMRAQAPGLADTFTPTSVLGGRAALRCTTPDYLPLVGGVPQYEHFLEDYGLLRKNARANIPTPGRYWPGLFINVGHGSRGLAYTPICAEILAAKINREPTPVGSHMETALQPGRFWIRDLIRKKR
ncbi:FAD-dependent 5-carboxymethylaminomethyl-2-thiouridine(34) oxidoreductase MnmC [Aestuariicella hydrocarbonica]|uniref:tRNA 5-methylaminomethyl-2-thiouridine biosynthesis bifunctional protein MnmC n=1 Tax=Pseudomaricurvus hydrocarbonicus TaxID=1470433 RepID=A0A9E5JT28_9GAMM|nr:FAD-dependent 5-carboxymethylaminomethyl-2-thiouridine(34) oxidoreductase MnmC [Aestuariicella hydrocarbonica]NHO64804.1 FAD-dependent 5-carboxymethylaminomethyl-2-thiouridine(34) oxidoreductase MnmC [Aestuariicella hydrocarbonica]